MERFNLRRVLENIVLSEGFKPIDLPTMNNVNLWPDLGNTKKQVYYLSEDKILAPEGTKIVMDWYDKTQNGKKDVKVFYFEKMFRKERRQKGRYNEFYQLGVEWLNPSDDKAYAKLVQLSEKLVQTITNDYDIAFKVDRGSDYYINGKGWEISVEKLGSQKQVVGGGAYRNGIGFAVGFDRLLLSK